MQRQRQPLPGVGAEVGYTETLEWEATLYISWPNTSKAGPGTLRLCRLWVAAGQAQLRGAGGGGPRAMLG